MSSKVWESRHTNDLILTLLVVWVNLYLNQVVFKVPFMILIYYGIDVTERSRRWLKLLLTAIRDVIITSWRSWYCPFRGHSIITPSLALPYPQQTESRKFGIPGSWSFYPLYQNALVGEPAFGEFAVQGTFIQEKVVVPGPPTRTVNKTCFITGPTLENSTGPTRHNSSAIKVVHDLLWLKL